MQNQILPPSYFTKGTNEDWSSRVEIPFANRAFAGCTDDINVWTVITQDAVTVYASSKPTSDVFVIIETGVQ
jgi:hypothetical protein